MSQIARSAASCGLPSVDLQTIDGFLEARPGEAETAVLFFTGDPARPEASDVAVVLPELVTAFAGAIRAGLVAREAEAALMSRFGVRVLPSLALVRDGRTLGIIPKIQDWSVYIDRIGRLLDAERAGLQGATA